MLIAANQKIPYSSCNRINFPQIQKQDIHLTFHDTCRRRSALRASGAHLRVISEATFVNVETRHLQRCIGFGQPGI